MKLRNKKTGEINLGDLYLDDFNSLAELNEEWEDYEEPKEYWCISPTGSVWEQPFQVSIDCINDSNKELSKQIGNYFETEEEAEKAVEKLKAWKRLKDKGFRFNGGDDACISYLLDPIKWDDELEKDFDLLFGGEE